MEVAGEVTEIGRDVAPVHPKLAREARCGSRPARQHLQQLLPEGHASMLLLSFRADDDDVRV
jgi:hypothetical protein